MVKIDAELLKLSPK